MHPVPPVPVTTPELFTLDSAAGAEAQGFGDEVCKWSEISHTIIWRFLFWHITLYFQLIHMLFSHTWDLQTTEVAALYNHSQGHEASLRSIFIVGFQ